MENDYLYSSSDNSNDNSDGDLIIFEDSSSGSSEVVEDSSSGSSEVVEDSSSGSSEVVEDSSSGSSEVIEDSSSGSSDVIETIDYSIYFDDISSKLDTLILQTNGVQEFQALTEIRDSVTESHDLQTNVNDLSLVEILLFVLCVFFGLNFAFKIGGHLL